MGVPKLLATLTPYGQRQPLEGHRLVIDGPALAYHAASLCRASPQKMEGRGHCFDQATAGQIGEAALAWLDALCRHGSTIEALYFDASLPPSKLPTRLERTYRTSMQWKDVFMSYQRELPGYETGIQRPNGRLPPPALTVPAVLDALRQSPVYGPLTTLVPGEADAYCALHVRSGGRGTIITSDSDLLVHDLGPEGHVVFFRGIDLAVTPLLVPVFSPSVIQSRLALDPHNGMRHFAFELFMDPHLSLNGLLERARKAVAVSRYPQDYEQFMEPYTSVLHTPTDTILNKHELDPRVSELVLQCLALDAGQDSMTSDTDDASAPRVFLPQILESWTRASAWEISAPLRQCAYGLLSLATGRRLPAVREYTRMASLSSQGSQLVLPPTAEMGAALAQLTTLLLAIQARIREPQLWWVVLSTYQDIDWSRQHGKDSVSLTVLCQETPADGILQRPSWNAAHWASQITATLYSLRMLRQLMEVVCRESGGLPCSAELAQLAQLAQLRELVSVSSATPLSDYPSLWTLRDLPSRLRESGALAVLSELAGLPEAIEFGPQTQKKGGHKKRKQPHQAASVDGNPRHSKNPFALLDDA